MIAKRLPGLPKEDITSMRFIVFFCCLISAACAGFCQKAPINYTAIDNWVSVDNTALVSNSGTYVVYGIDSISNR